MKKLDQFIEDVKKENIEHINKNKIFTPQSIYNSVGVQGNKGPNDSGLRLNRSKPKGYMSSKKEFYLILIYTLMMVVGSIFIAYHSPIECDQECLESYYD